MNHDKGNMTLEGGIPSELGRSKKLKLFNMSKYSSHRIVCERIIFYILFTDIYIFLHDMCCLFIKAGNNITGKIPSEMGECESLNDIDIGKMIQSICTDFIVHNASYLFTHLGFL